MDQPGNQLRFSIIVPAYNEAAYLGRALHSLQHQDYDGNYLAKAFGGFETSGPDHLAHNGREQDQQRCRLHSSDLHEDDISCRAV